MSQKCTFCVSFFTRIRKRALVCMCVRHVAVNNALGHDGVCFLRVLGLCNTKKETTSSDARAILYCFSYMDVQVQKSHLHATISCLSRMEFFMCIPIYCFLLVTAFEYQTFHRCRAGPLCGRLLHVGWIAHCGGRLSTSLSMGPPGHGYPLRYD